MAKLISDYFCVAMSGKTVDGRDINPDWLTEAGKGYNAEFYAARVWLEHRRWMGAMGDVFAVKTETEASGIVRMYTRIIPTPELIDMKHNSKALYSSIEIAPKLERTGKAYLVGLAVTDSPASFGTERMEFSARHLVDDSLFAQAFQIENMEFSTERSIFDMGLNMGKKLLGIDDAPPTTKSAPPPVNPKTFNQPSQSEDDDMTLEELNAALDAKLLPFKQQLDAMDQKFTAAKTAADKFSEDLAPLKEGFEQIKAGFESLSQKQDEIIELATPPAGNPPEGRKPHTGGDPDKKTYSC